jgi:polyferredoxin
MILRTAMGFNFYIHGFNSLLSGLEYILVFIYKNNINLSIYYYSYIRNLALALLKKFRPNLLIKFLSAKRRWIQGIFAIALYAALSFLGLNLWIILAIGLVSGIIFGKVFCRWACPIGFIDVLSEPYIPDTGI